MSVRLGNRPQAVVDHGEVDGTVTVDAAGGYLHKMVAVGNVTIANPRNLRVGDELIIKFVQDGSGSRTATFGSLFVFADEGGAAVSSAANSISVVRGIWDGEHLLCTLHTALSAL